MDLNPDVIERVKKLEEKYRATEQDLTAYLDGLLYADYLTYWDYIHLDTLLSLQKPRTGFPDEEIFIIYHQITELYFKLALHELRQINSHENPDRDFLAERVGRVNRYFGALTHSFGVMEKGMEQRQFLKFRMSLTPASGFQSVQYRMIEIASTEFINLIDHDVVEEYRDREAGIRELYEHIYWKKGAIVAETGEKTLTLQQFEIRYDNYLIDMAESHVENNLWTCYKKLPEADQQDPDVIHAFRMLDVNANVNWPLQHYKTAVRYLARRPVDIPATGGTNWQKYLPPKFQKRIFYPELWSEQEKEAWGKAWVEAALKETRINK